MAEPLLGFVGLLLSAALVLLCLYPVLRLAWNVLRRAFEAIRGKATTDPPAKPPIEGSEAFVDQLARPPDGVDTPTSATASR